MKMISFAWTTPALLAGKKSCTRRDWTAGWARQFRAGDLVAAYDRQPRYRGQEIATIRLTQAPYQESTALAPDSDWEAEGFEYLQAIGAKVDGVTPNVLWRIWRELQPQLLYVVRFELVK